MRKAVPAVLVLCLTAFASAQSPADGKWAFIMSSPMGQVSAQVALKAEGATLTGAFTLDGNRVWALEKGTIQGNEIAFTINRDRPSGGAMAYGMKGTIKGDTITGTASAEGSTVDWSMARAQ